MSNPHFFVKYDVPVIDSFIAKFAIRYIEQRKQMLANISSLNENQMFMNSGFDVTQLKEIITQNAVAHDYKRENGQTPPVFNDIYRSDLGELLMTYYFEEKIGKESQYVIPLKNITFRELAEMPGRGLDAIGYRKTGNRLDVLLGEAKVSAEKKNPPAVVDKTQDSIFLTQLTYKQNPSKTIRRLTDYCRRLSIGDAEMIGLAILYLNSGKRDYCSITFGCTLIRDESCVDETKDFGKLQTDSGLFDPDAVHFSVLSFTGKTIEETVQAFFEKVKELVK